jgi:hypothetical protein
MKQAGFCVDQGCWWCEFGLIFIIFSVHNSGDQLTITAKWLLLIHHNCSWYLPWMIWDGFDGNQWTLCHEAGRFVFVLMRAVEDFIWFFPFPFHNSGDQLTITAKPLLLNHHKCSWYLPWIIWDDFDGNQWTLC